MKVIFLLVTLPNRWNTFCTSVNNFAPASGLPLANVESSLLVEEVNIKNLNSIQGGNALYFGGRSKERGKSNDKGKSGSKS